MMIQVASQEDQVQAEIHLEDLAEDHFQEEERQAAGNMRLLIAFLTLLLVVVFLGDYAVLPFLIGYLTCMFWGVLIVREPIIRKKQIKKI
jgi:uncharacterized membrane protein